MSFFLCGGFIWNLFNVLATFLQETFALSMIDISLGTSVSFLSFFLMSYPARIIIHRLGTRKSISLGALIIGLGLIIFCLVSLVKVYVIPIVGLFIIFSGVTVLQTVCNPYIGILGNIRNRAARINFAQGIGAIGAALKAPVGSWAILQIFENNVWKGICVFYMLIAAIFILLSILVFTAKMPQNPTEVSPEVSGGAERGGAFRYRHFGIGLIVMFLYMGLKQYCIS